MVNILIYDVLLSSNPIIEFDSDNNIGVSNKCGYDDNSSLIMKVYTCILHDILCTTATNLSQLSGKICVCVVLFGKTSSCSILL